MSTEYVNEQIVQASKTDFASVEAEQSVLSRMLKNADVARKYAGELTQSDFTNPDYGMIYRAIQAVVVDKKPVDLVEVDAALQRLYPLDENRLSVVMVELVSKTNYTEGRLQNTESHIQIIKGLATRRRSISAFENIAALWRDPTRSIEEILDEVHATTSKIVNGKRDWQNIQDVMLSTFDYLEKRQQGKIKSITTGIKNVDNLIGGFFGGELTVIGARPSVGKSAFGVNVAVAAARQGFRVGIVSREMTDVQYGSRLMAHEAWVDGMKLRKGDIDGDDWGRIAESMSDIGALPIEFLFSVRTVDDLVRDVQRRCERGELDMLVVDYLQLLETERQFKQENLRVGFISTSLKHLATDCNIPVIALAQVNRDTDGNMPTLKSLKASGDIEQDADGVLFLHRPTDANDPYIDPRDRNAFYLYEQKGLSYICIGVAKQRQGATGRACVLFDPAYMRYIEIDRTGTEPRQLKGE